MTNSTLLQVLPALKSGGVERYTLDVARAFPGGYIVSQGGDLVSEIQGAESIILPVKSKNPICWMSNALALYQIIKEKKVSIIHVRSRAPAYSVGLAAKWAGIPWVSTYHGNYRAQNALKCFYNKQMLRADACIVHSQFIKNMLEERYTSLKHRIAFFYEGIDTTLFNPDRFDAQEIQKIREDRGIKHGETLIICPGRIGKGKGQEVFINALKEIVAHGYKDMAPFKVVIVGSGDPFYVEDIKKKAKDLPFVMVENATPHMPILYAASDMVVAPAVHGEAFGRVCVEAMAMNCLFLGTRIGATPELVEGVYDSYLSVPQCSQALAHNLMALINASKEQKKNLCKAARKRVIERFSLTHMIEHTKKLYESLL
jgi:glycosyltransferase involved in cell wall biosynthesis